MSTLIGRNSPVHASWAVTPAAEAAKTAEAAPPPEADPRAAALDVAAQVSAVTVAAATMPQPWLIAAAQNTALPGLPAATQAAHSVAAMQSYAVI